MRSREEILEAEAMLIKMKCRSEVIHTELLLDIRDLLKSEDNRRTNLLLLD